MEKEGVGTFGGQAKLTINGNSIRDMAAAADGELAVIMDGGQINALIIEALGLDLGEVLAVLAAGDEEKEKGMVPVQCLVSRFDVQDGVDDPSAGARNERQYGDRVRHDRPGPGGPGYHAARPPKGCQRTDRSTPVAIKGTFREPQIDVVSEDWRRRGWPPSRSAL